MIPGTLISRVYDTGHSVVDCAISRKHHIPKQIANNSISDSLQMVLSSENFIKPYSEQHILAVLLTKYFQHIMLYFKSILFVSFKWILFCVQTVFPM